MCPEGNDHMKKHAHLIIAREAAEALSLSRALTEILAQASTAPDRGGFPRDHHGWPGRKAIAHHAEWARVQEKAGRRRAAAQQLGYAWHFLADALVPGEGSGSAREHDRFEAECDDAARSFWITDCDWGPPPPPERTLKRVEEELSEHIGQRPKPKQAVEIAARLSFWTGRAVFAPTVQADLRARLEAAHSEHLKGLKQSAAAHGLALVSSQQRRLVIPDEERLPGSRWLHPGEDSSAARRPDHGLDRLKNLGGTFLSRDRKMGRVSREPDIASQPIPLQRVYNAYQRTVEQILARHNPWYRRPTPRELPMAPRP